MFEDSVHDIRISIHYDLTEVLCLERDVAMSTSNIMCRSSLRVEVLLRIVYKELH